MVIWKSSLQLIWYEYLQAERVTFSYDRYTFAQCLAMHSTRRRSLTIHESQPKTVKTSYTPKFVLNLRKVFADSGAVSVDLNIVSHINKFGDTPHCVIDRDYFLAKWCVCPDKADNIME
jgi:hypothetical protein